MFECSPCFLQCSSSSQVQHVLPLCRISSCSHRKRRRIHVAKTSCVKPHGDGHGVTGRGARRLQNKRATLPTAQVNRCFQNITIKTVVTTHLQLWESKYTMYTLCNCMQATCYPISILLNVNLNRQYIACS